MRALPSQYRPNLRPAPRLISGLLLATLSFALAFGGCEISPTDFAAVDADNGLAAPVEFTEPVEMGQHLTMALTSKGRRVLATWDATDHRLLVGWEDGQGTIAWRSLRPDDTQTPDVGQGISLAVDADDIAHIAFFDQGAGRLLYGRMAEQAGATVEIVDAQPGSVVGREPSLALNAAGLPRIAYRDDTGRRLRYATLDAEGSWALETIGGCAKEVECPVLDAEDYGLSPALAVVGGAPQIAFYDAFRGDLKLAVRSPLGKWVVTTLDGRDPVTGIDNGDAGRHCAIAADPKGRIGVAYLHRTDGALRYAFPSAGSEPLTVDAGARIDDETGLIRQDLVGQHIALTFDSNDIAQVVYLNASTHRLSRAAIKGTHISGPQSLELSGGGWIAIQPDATDQLIGAYGRWSGPNLATELMRFKLPATIENGPEVAP